MILLDTHTWIWAHSATKLLSDNVKRLIKKTQTDQRAIASISIWEFAMMVTKGRINVSFHKDPADRIIVATARTHNLMLLTKDRKIIEYPHVQAVW